MKGRKGDIVVTQQSAKTLSSCKSTLPRISYLPSYIQQVRRDSKLLGLTSLVSIKHQSCEATDKLFYFDSEDAYIKRILMENGWKQNNNQMHKLPKLVWAYNLDKVPEWVMKKGSMVNHFRQSYQLTTKQGLRQSLYRFCSVQFKPSSFYPRSYDLHSEVGEFEKDFDRTAMLNLLKKYIVYAQLYYGMSLDKALQNQRNVDFVSFMQSQKFQSQINPGLVFNKRFMVYSLLWFQNYKNSLDIYQQTMETKGYFMSFPKRVLQQLLEFSQIDPPYVVTDTEQWGTPTQECLWMLRNYAKLFERRLCFYRNDGFSNIWIVKPSQSSKGRHLKLVSTKQEVRRFHSQSCRIVQKYLQNIWVFTEKELAAYSQTNPMPSELGLLLGRKFDIRMWVLVTSFQPLEVYCFDQGYLRLASSDYGFTSLNNHRQHLTNYAVNKHYINDSDSFVLLSSFVKHISQVYGHTNLISDIHRIIVQTVSSASISPSTNSFQLLGFDLILDCDLKPWLLEVNMSPSCRQRGRLKEVVREMGRGLLQIVGLIPSHQTLPRNRWNKIYSEKPLHSQCYRPDLNIMGINIPIPTVYAIDAGINLKQAVLKIQQYCRLKNNGKQISRQTTMLSRTKHLISVLVPIVKLMRARWLRWSLDGVRQWAGRKDKERRGCRGKRRVEREQGSTNK